MKITYIQLGLIFFFLINWKKAFLLNGSQLHFQIFNVCMVLYEWQALKTTPLKPLICFRYVDIWVLLDHVNSFRKSAKVHNGRMITIFFNGRYSCNPNKGSWFFLFFFVCVCNIWWMLSSQYFLNLYICE